MIDEELDRFKQLDLRQIAASLGYAIDRRESSRNSTVMRKDHDKIIISRKPDLHYTYWSPRDEGDRGTVIDLLQTRKGLSLGSVRKELRAWSNMPTPPLPCLPSLGSTKKDIEAVRRLYDTMPFAIRHSYLENERRIPVEILQHPRFDGKVRIDRRGAAVFPHVDVDGQICGYELKNKLSDGRTFTGFSPGGRKGIYLSNKTACDRRLVLVESGIEALSYAAMFGNLEVTRYGSIGGKPTPVQRTIMCAAILEMPGGSEIVAATNADEAGRELAAGMKGIFDQGGRADLAFRRDEPHGANDWNDLLRTGVQKRPLPFRAEEPRVV